MIYQIAIAISAIGYPKKIKVLKVCAPSAILGSHQARSQDLEKGGGAILKE